MFPKPFPSPCTPRASLRFAALAYGLLSGMTVSPQIAYAAQQGEYITTTCSQTNGKVGAIMVVVLDTQTDLSSVVSNTGRMYISRYERNPDDPNDIGFHFIEQPYARFEIQASGLAEMKRLDYPKVEALKFKCDPWKQVIEGDKVKPLPKGDGL